MLEGLSYLAAMRNSKVGRNRTPVEGQQGPPGPERIFHPRSGSSRNEVDEDKVIKKGTRFSSARPSLWRWTTFLLFLSFLTSYHFLRFVNQVQTSKEVWCHFQEVWRLDVHSFHLNFYQKVCWLGRSPFQIARRQGQQGACSRYCQPSCKS